MASLTLIFVVVLLAFMPVSMSIPFVIFHGIADSCSGGASDLVKLLTNLTGSPGSCLEIGTGKHETWFMPLSKQARIACNKLKEMKELSQGYNIVGQSMGNMVARGLIEFCDGGPPVRNYISLGGPHAGIAEIPQCRWGFFCRFLFKLFRKAIYSDFMQDHFAPSGIIKLPNAMSTYLRGCKYLPKLNNEKPKEWDSAVKERFSKLQNLVLIMSENVLFPKETSWFGFHPDGGFGTPLPVQKTKLYTEDRIGLKALDVRGKVKFVSVPGKHIAISQEDLIKYVVPYLQ